MKRVGLLLIIIFLMTSCASKKMLRVEVTNNSSIDRVNEIVSVDWKEITSILPLIGDRNVIVLNDSGKQVPCQLVYKGKPSPQQLIFPVSITSGNKINYSINKGYPEVFAKKTHGRSIPERKDDFAWENDRMAYRMYGPALATENPSNGVDIWLKRTDELIVDKFYWNELKNKRSYHVDHGQGLDCYKVAHTLGAGGIAPFVKDSLWVGGYYAKARVLDSGLLRTSFVLEYDSISVDGKILKEKLIVTLDAFSQLNKAEVSYDGDFQSFSLAAGIWLHNEIGNVKMNKKSGYIAYGEKAVSDAKLESGKNYVGILFPYGMHDARKHHAHLLGFADYKKGDTFTYYFGAGWSKWGFAFDIDWFNYMDHFSIKLKEPLKVLIK